MPEHIELGKSGELMAADYLKSRGYKILEMNWKSRNKEIDIIALDENEIVFIEVKTRKSNYFGDPEEAVNLIKQKFLINAAEDYIVSNKIDLDARFDIISVISDGSKHNINHIKEAFCPGIG
jgi:putative endonuclease